MRFHVRMNLCQCSQSANVCMHRGVRSAADRRIHPLLEDQIALIDCGFVTEASNFRMYDYSYRLTDFGLVQHLALDVFIACVVGKLYGIYGVDFKSENLLSRIERKLSSKEFFH